MREGKWAARCSDGHGAVMSLRAAATRQALGRIAPNFVYARADGVVGATPRRRTEARRLLAGLHFVSYAVFDFRGINSVTHSFIDELLEGCVIAGCSTWEAINASRSIELAIDRARILVSLKPRSD
jgi:hypothetical protein